MTQNTSHSVMAQRQEPADSLDDFPTPPWAVRALLRHVLGFEHLQKLSALEPSCGRGHMARTLEEAFPAVLAADIHDYGFGAVEDFLLSNHFPNAFDWVITNPPFRLAEEFALKAFPIARQGVAMLQRTTFMEGIARHRRLFLPHRPAIIAQFCERVPMFRGRLSSKGSTATAYAWFVWRKGDPNEQTALKWILPCRKNLERAEDYNAPVGRRLTRRGLLS